MTGATGGAGTNRAGERMGTALGVHCGVVAAGPLLGSGVRSSGAFDRSESAEGDGWAAAAAAASMTDSRSRLSRCTAESRLRGVDIRTEKLTETTLRCEGQLHVLASARLAVQPQSDKLGVAFRLTN